MTLTHRLDVALRAAVKARDAVATSALRGAVSAIANAGAVPRAHGGLPPAGAIEQTRLGVGVADVPRRRLSEGDVVRIVEAEITEREEAAVQYERLGRVDQAARLRAEAGILRSRLDGVR